MAHETDKWKSIQKIGCGFYRIDKELVFPGVLYAKEWPGYTWGKVYPFDFRNAADPVAYAGQLNWTNLKLLQSLGNSVSTRDFDLLQELKKIKDPKQIEALISQLSAQLKDDVQDNPSYIDILGDENSLIGRMISLEKDMKFIMQEIKDIKNAFHIDSMISNRQGTVDDPKTPSKD